MWWTCWIHRFTLPAMDQKRHTPNRMHSRGNVPSPQNTTGYVSTEMFPFSIAPPARSEGEATRYTKHVACCSLQQTRPSDFSCSTKPEAPAPQSHKLAKFEAAGTPQCHPLTIEPFLRDRPTGYGPEESPPIKKKKCSDSPAALVL